MFLILRYVFTPASGQDPGMRTHSTVCRTIMETVNSPPCLLRGKLPIDTKTGKTETLPSHNWQPNLESKCPVSHSSCYLPSMPCINFLCLSCYLPKRPIEELLSALICPLPLMSLEHRWLPQPMSVPPLILLLSPTRMCIFRNEGRFWVSESFSQSMPSHSLG